MAAIVEKLRAQCRIDTDDATDDELLMLYFRAACRKAKILSTVSFMRRWCRKVILKGCL